MPSEFTFVGPNRGCAALAKIKSLHLESHKPDQQVLGWFYGALNILDSKANGLMRVNSSFITILIFFFGLAQARFGSGTDADKKLFVITNGQMVAGGICLALLLASTFLCFMIVRVSWRFLGHVNAKADGSGYDFGSEAERLANVVDDRTHYYLIGWYLTLFAAAIPILMWVQTGIAKLQ